jgi:hypothetical protein
MNLTLKTLNSEVVTIIVSKLYVITDNISESLTIRGFHLKRRGFCLMATCTRKLPAKSILRKNYEYLVNELRVSTYLDAFFSEEVISLEDMENLQKERGKVEQARKFLGLLLHTAEENIKKFFEILKTRQDKQPHIYRHLFSHADDQTAGDQATGDGLRQPIARTDDETVSSSLTTSRAQWEEQVIPHFPALVEELRPNLLLHHLRAAHLLTATEFDQLQEKSMTELDQSERLINTMLPCKKRAVERFCQVL